MDLKKLSKVADSQHTIEDNVLRKPLSADLMSQLADLNGMTLEDFVFEGYVRDNYMLQELYESETEFEEDMDDWYDDNVTEQPGSEDSDSWLMVFQIDKIPESLKGIHILRLTEEQVDHARV